MQYMLLIYENEKRWSNPAAPEMAAEMKEYETFGETFGKIIKGGNALQPTRTATSVRIRDGKRLTTDGPFAETKEQLGGYYLIDAPDLDAALEAASKIPAVRNGTIEIRPIMNFG